MTNWHGHPCLCATLVLTSWTLALLGDHTWRFLHVSWHAIDLLIQLGIMLLLVTMSIMPGFQWGQLWPQMPFWLRQVSLALSGSFLFSYLIDMSCVPLLHPIWTHRLFQLIKVMSYFSWFWLIHSHQKMNWRADSLKTVSIPWPTSNWFSQMGEKSVQSVVWLFWIKQLLIYCVTFQ